MIRPMCIEYVNFVYLHICEDIVNCCVIDCCTIVDVLFYVIFGKF